MDNQVFFFSVSADLYSLVGSEIDLEIDINALDDMTEEEKTKVLEAIKTASFVIAEVMQRTAMQAFLNQQQENE